MLLSEPFGGSPMQEAMINVQATTYRGPGA